LRKFIFSFIAILIISLSISSLFFWYLKDYPVCEKEKILSIPENVPAKVICNILQENKIIPSSNILFLLIKITKNDKNLKSGEYKFFKGMSYYNVLDFLISGKIYLFKITIPEGLNIFEISELLERENVIRSAKEFISFCNNKQAIKRFLNNGFSMEGYLFPDTYKFYKYESVKKVIKTLNDNFIKKVLPLYKNSRTYYTLNEVIILASIIQKETYNKKEMPIIASVFFNRLKKGMRLQSDPTIIYGLWDEISGRLKRSDLKIENEYNTYLNYGLTPTPISNPGISAIKAVLNPAKTDYLFFVSTGKGYHIFAKTYKQHLRNVRKYIRAR